MIKVVRSVTPDANSILASFELVDGKVVATYISTGYKHEIENVGIFAGGTHLTPADGRAFMDALDKAYATSSFMNVESSGDDRPLRERLRG